jgi:hypothetical protein
MAPHVRLKPDATNRELKPDATKIRNPRLSRGGFPACGVRFASGRVGTSVRGGARQG